MGIVLGRCNPQSNLKHTRPQHRVNHRNTTSWRAKERPLLGTFLGESTRVDPPRRQTYSPFPFSTGAKRRDLLSRAFQCHHFPPVSQHSEASPRQAAFVMRGWLWPLRSWCCW